MFKLTIFSAIIVLIDWLVKLYVFGKISNLKPHRKQTFGFLLLVLIIYIINPLYGLLLEPLYLPLLVFLVLKPSWKILQGLFYSLMPFVLVELTQRMTNLYTARYLLLMETPDFIPGFWLTVVGLLAILICYFFFIKVMAVDFQVVRQMFHHRKFTKVLRILSVGLLTYAAFLHPLLTLSGTEQEAVLEFGNSTSTLSIDILFSYLVLFVTGLIYLNYKSKDLMAMELQAAKDSQLADLTRYSQHVEALYGELRSFRHDYSNVLVSLNLAIKDRDIDQVEQIYQSVMANSDKAFYESKYDIAKLANLQDPAVKSLVSAKLMTAQAQGVTISVEIEEPIGPPDIDLLEFIQILSIFLDNAIEATVKADKPALLLAYFQEGKDKILVIENSTAEASVNTRQIFADGYSTKGTNRGIGLANVRTILSKYPKASLETQSYKHRFSQVLTCRGE
ncbi:sensor histidine kinase [Streptococcus caprae]|uniref:Sensor histidine kinase n=1 Tax=Streptococcus caprae TaxID=1640501 RepID=A0ABV8CWB1_9STRE